ncbi:MAG: hypothetical protein PWP60_916 [Candidatus Atribacteria bacterium]|jgi:hypothetical protein|uniref:Uncharacterized protein n=1 Tax=Thermatribacter velox TaxID=3039681 RepID=A0ABZ2YDH1_9BACT|nr:hypothetical protein [Candidatus Atribacteria bacterium]
MQKLEELERLLDDFNPEVRRSAFLKICDMEKRGEITFQPPLPIFNLHFHTFFSFNAYGYSPLHIIYKAKKERLEMAGSVDFDVLDAMPEFLWGGLSIGIRVASGIETRIYLPEFKEQELSSPNEPGVAYYMGNGFTRLPTPNSTAEKTLTRLREIAQNRNLKVIEKINAYLPEVAIDYEKDVLPLTPGGNPTERHIIKAYDSKAELVFPKLEERIEFWSQKLCAEPLKLKSLINNKPDFYDFLRTKLAKFGGVGYIEPDAGDFPTLKEVNSMIWELGAIPSFSWLDGTRDGEKDPDFLLDFCLEKNIESIFLVPDRNWNLEDPAERKTKVANLYAIVEAAKKRAMPIFVGTELNKYGQKFVDDFDSPYLKPLAPYFRESAMILWGHTVLEMTSQRGYSSDWAARHFSNRLHKNEFFARLGKSIPPDKKTIDQVGQMNTPELLQKFGSK